MKAEWNVSKLAVLRQCHRKFYFAYELAEWHFTYPVRRKAFELSKMKTLKMWQGDLIDQAITKKVIPVYKRKQTPDYKQIADELVALAKRQFLFSKNGYYKDPQIDVSEAGMDRLTLDIHEANVPFEQADVEAVYSNIHQIILAFPNYGSPEKGKTMNEYLSAATHLRADVRYFKYLYNDIQIKPQVDLVRHAGRFTDVIDWKVSESDTADYEKQLTLEGIAVFHGIKNWFIQRKWVPLPTLQNYQLFEINLMNGAIKQHPFTKKSTAIALDYVATLSDEQEQLSQNKPWNELDAEAYETTDKVETCMTCKFRTLCRHLIFTNFNYDEDEYYKLVQVKELA